MVRQPYVVLILEKSFHGPGAAGHNRRHVVEAHIFPSMADHMAWRSANQPGPGWVWKWRELVNGDPRDAGAVVANDYDMAADAVYEHYRGCIRGKRSNMITPFHGIAIQVSQTMIGSKKAVRFGNGPIILSPAMWELVKGAESGDELRRLLEAIPLLTMPPMPSIYDPLPLTTRPGI